MRNSGFRSRGCASLESEIPPPLFSFKFITPAPRKKPPPKYGR